jgi:small subunit ribosomal protein S8
MFIENMKNYLWNMFANIKNGQMAKKGVILQPRNNICESFLKILWDEGFISGYRIFAQNNKKIEIFLKYTQAGKPVINSLKCLSKPGQRLYYSAKQIWKLDSSKTFIIFSTNKGLKTISQCKKNKIGGEPLIVIN